jgi:hypothetical protein
MFDLVLELNRERDFDSLHYLAAEFRDVLTVVKVHIKNLLLG